MGYGTNPQIKRTRCRAVAGQHPAVGILWLAILRIVFRTTVAILPEMP